jgi:hypothetical protein
MGATATTRRPDRAGRAARTARLVVVVAVLAAGAVACVPPLSTPGSTGSIQLVSTATDSGYRVEFYRNTAYPCSISGHQTFAIAYRDGTPTTAARPLWTYLHGGAVGWFDAAGVPQPSDDFMREESLSALTGNGHQPGLMARILGDEAAFRLLVVSMCNRDLYSGAGQVDPNNPNRLPNGAARTTNGLLATKAAVQFARQRFATTKFFLHGGSAGSVGTYSAAWSLQQQGIPPAGIVADSFVVNQEWALAALEQDVPCGTVEPSITHMTPIKARIHPDLGNPANQADLLVSSGRLTVPIAQVWSHGDPWGCASAPIVCPLRDGTTVVMGSTDCMNEPLRRAIAAQGPTSRSISLGLCVGSGCSTHVVTAPAGTNTDPAAPADYNGALHDWVHQRLADS